MLLAQAERRLGIAGRLAPAIPDGRDASQLRLVKETLRQLHRQKHFGFMSAVDRISAARDKYGTA